MYGDAQCNGCGPGTTLGIYSEDGPTYEGGPSTTDSGSWYENIDWGNVWDQAGQYITGIYPKALPPPLPFTVGQVKAMLGDQPTIRQAIASTIAGQGHTHLYLGREPTAEDLQDLQTLAELALWFGNGTGDDLSRGEHEIRNMVIRGMQTQGGSQAPGGGWTSPDTVPAAVPPFLALGLLGAGIYLAYRSRG